MKTTRLRAGKGFTIIEVLIAMSILAFIVAAIYSSWSEVVRSTPVGLDAAPRGPRRRTSGPAW